MPSSTARHRAGGRAGRRWRVSRGWACGLARGRACGRARRRAGRRLHRAAPGRPGGIAIW